MQRIRIYIAIHVNVKDAATVPRAILVGMLSYKAKVPKELQYSIPLSGRLFDRSDESEPKERERAR